jgi:signal transduction histidine kinase
LIKLGIRGVLGLLAGAVSLFLFVGLILLTYTLTKDYEQRIADRLAVDLASAVAQLAYSDPTLWSFQIERIDSKVEAELRNEEPDTRGWSVSVILNDGQRVYERPADPARFEVVSVETIKAGFEPIGRINVSGEIYALPRRIAWTSLFAFLLSITLFLVLYFIPFRAIRNREASLTDALVLAKKSGDDVRASSERLNSAIASMQDGFALFDQYNRLALWNLPYQKIIEDWELTAGLDAGLDEILSRLSTAVAGQGDCVPDLETVGNKSTEANDQLEVTTPTGRKIDWRRVATISGDTLIIVRDTTKQREAEKRLRQAQKMEAVGQLTGGVAHDFNNLLTVITGNLELLETRARHNEQRELIVQAQEAAALGAKLSKQLLAFARRQPLDPKVIDLNALVLSMSDWLPRTLGETIQVVTVPAEDLNMTLADPGQVKNAILNLAINARDAMPNGGTLTIKTANAELDQDYADSRTDVPPGRYVVLSVTDTGFGIRPELADHIFEPFFTTKDEASGAGLGLSMVYGFAKQSGGFVTLDSEMGCGTNVSLYLPQVSAGAEVEVSEPALDTAAEFPRARGETVLVVEDNLRVRQLTVKRLTDLGYFVLKAEDGATALEFLQTGRRIDLLFTDLLMPGGMGGSELAREARRLRPGIKVLFASGYPGATTAQRGLLDGGAKLLTKPYTKAELVHGIRSTLDA